MSRLLKISVGVVAWNEEASIAAALQSVLDQTLFQNAAKLGVEAELVVIANGCTDRTVEVASGVLDRMRLVFPEDGPVQLRLVEEPEAGFANAWNLLSHTYSRKDAEYIFFVNADIVIDRADAFECMLNRIRKDYDMKVISPVGRKHIEREGGKTLFDRLNLAVTRFTERNQTCQVRGQCFCARAKAMRSVWLPKKFPGAVDGLFKRLIVSDMASALDNPARVGLAEDAGYTFEAYRTLSDIFNRRVRLFVGQTFIEVLLRHLKQMRVDRPGVNLSSYLQARDATDAAWLERLVQLAIHQEGLLKTMPSFWFRFRFWQNPKISRLHKIGMLPVAALAFVFDIPVFAVTALRLRSGKITDVWKDTSNRDQLEASV